MGKVISFYNIKGGVGKTTSTVNVAYTLAKQFGKRVLVVDIDPQSDTTDFFNMYDYVEDNKRYSTENIFTGKGIDNKTLSPIPIDLNEIICHTEWNEKENIILDIIPAQLSLSRAEKYLLTDTSSPQQFKLKAALSTVKNMYDYIVIDCAPTAETLLNTNALMASDYIFIPLKSDKWAVRGLMHVIRLVKSAEFFSEARLGGCFFCGFEKNTNIMRQLQLRLKGQLQQYLLNSYIRKSVSADEISHTGTPFLEYKASAGIAKDYVSLTEEIMNVCERGVQ